MRGTKLKPKNSFSSNLLDLFIIKKIESFTGITSLPFIFSCSFNLDGILSAAAETRILSNGAFSGNPFDPSPQINFAIPFLTKLYFSVFFSPNPFNSLINLIP